MIYLSYQNPKNINSKKNKFQKNYLKPFILKSANKLYKTEEAVLYNVISAGISTLFPSTNL